MAICSVFGCHHKTGGKAPDGVTFHRFPNESCRREAWIAAVRRDNWQPTKYSVICSVHFPETDINRTALLSVRLRENVVPTIFPSFPKHLQKEGKKRKPPTPRPFLQSESMVHTTDVGQSATAEESQPNSSQADTIIEEGSSAGLLDTPRKKELKRKLENAQQQLMSAKKKVKLLLQSKRRLIKRNATLKDVVGDLKKSNLMGEDHIHLLKDTLIGAPGFILKRQLNKIHGQPNPTRYASQIRAFAMTLHFHSPQAYRYVRKTFDTCLPHPRTIVRWYESTDGGPGFTAESMRFLQAMAKKAKEEGGRDILCTLLMDEMATRQHLEYDGKRYYGYIDMGIGMTDDSLPLAKEAMTFMLVAINGSWKIPVGYFLIDGLSGVERANLVKSCLELIHNTGVRVVALTFDGLSSNFTMARNLGCNFDTPRALITSFPHPVSKENVYVYLDPCHMLKLVRNTLGDKKCLADGGDGVVLWKYFTNLHQLQEEEGLHAANKLRSGHMQWEKQKMKVKLAVQLFSDSVADAMEFCKQEQIADFKSSCATIKFIRIMNRLFDIFNSRNTLQKAWKAPISARNARQALDFLQEAQEYILGLKTNTGSDAISILHTNRKTGFLGFLICIQSLRNMCNDFIANEQLRFLPTYKLSQDHLELFFGIIRSKGGCNNNPTVRQLMGAYKRTLVHNELMSLTTGNCTAQDLTYLPSCTTPEQTINATNVRYRSIEEDATEPQFDEHSGGEDVLAALHNCHMDALVDHEYSCTLSHFAKNVVVYIGGWVVQSLIKSLKCVECIHVLTENFESGKSNPLYSLIHLESRGGLTYPSSDVITICLESERVYRYALALNGRKPLDGTSNTLPRLSVKVARNLRDTPIFQGLAEHIFDQAPMDNHIGLLMRAVTNKYLALRYYHSGKLHCTKMHMDSVRQKLTKVILFKGQ